MKGSEEMEEIWEPIPEYEGYYEVSNTGKVRSVTRTIIFNKTNAQHIYYGKELSLNKRGDYLRVCLTKNGTKKYFDVHRLVALAFLPNPGNLPIVNHKDENKTNNCVNNLEWCTYSYNTNYGTGIERQIRKTSRPIIMCDKETHEPIKEFPSLAEAARSLGMASHGNISMVLNGTRPSASGYWWKYKE